MNKQVEQIKAEIERLQDSTMDSNCNFYSQAAEEKYHLLCHLENFINSLPEEPVSEDLEKAAVEAFKNIVEEDRNSFLEIFKAGAQWKEQQMIEKAVEWLVNNMMCTGYTLQSKAKFIRDFRKTMSDNTENE